MAIAYRSDPVVAAKPSSSMTANEIASVNEKS
jgi:hypothetical protein